MQQTFCVSSLLEVEKQKLVEARSQKLEARSIKKKCASMLRVLCSTRHHFLCCYTTYIYSTTPLFCFNSPPILLIFYYYDILRYYYDYLLVSLVAIVCDRTRPDILVITSILNKKLSGVNQKMHIEYYSGGFLGPPQSAISKLYQGKCDRTVLCRAVSTVIYKSLLNTNISHQLALVLRQASPLTCLLLLTIISPIKKVVRVA